MRNKRPSGIPVPVGTRLVAGTTLCCAMQGPAWQTPEPYGCVPIADGEASRLRCYDEGFEVLHLQGPMRAEAGGRLQAIAPEQSINGFSHRCAASFSCPGGPRIDCTAQGEGASCEQIPDEARVVCRDANGESEAQCPKVDAPIANPPNEKAGAASAAPTRPPS